MTNWINTQNPIKASKDIGVIQLAWLGDSVWELHQRLRHINMPAKSRDLHLSVVSEVQAIAQVESLKFIEPLLNDSEINLIRRARNKTKRCPKAIEPIIYAQSTGFETLIGWLFLHNPKRLSQLFEHLELKSHKITNS